jgi:hypothetical protein
MGCLFTAVWLWAGYLPASFFGSRPVWGGGVRLVCYAAAVCTCMLVSVYVGVLEEWCVCWCLQRLFEEV